MFPLKYIIDSNNNFVLFNRQSITMHSDMKPFFDGKIVGAGFCRINGGGRVVCTGRSETLNIDSRPKEDSDIITNYFKENHCKIVAGEGSPFDIVFATNIKGIEDYWCFSVVDEEAELQLVKYL
jgi:hypothetical protein